MTGYGRNRAWSDQFIPVVRELVGPYLLVPSSLEVDRTQATDLVVFRARDFDIACRIRRPGAYERYPNEFTLRSWAASGRRTEFDKIVDGWADWLFYGHAQTDDGPIWRWLLIDLHSFRAHLIRDKGAIKSGYQRNRDGTTGFTWFDVRSFPPEPPLLIAQSLHEPEPSPADATPVAQETAVPTLEAHS